MESWASPIFLSYLPTSLPGQDANTFQASPRVLAGSGAASPYLSAANVFKEALVQSVMSPGRHRFEREFGRADLPPTLDFFSGFVDTQLTIASRAMIPK